MTEAEGTSSDQAASAAPATASKASNAKKRKSVRFNIPVKGEQPVGTLQHSFHVFEGLSLVCEG